MTEGDGSPERKLSGTVVLTRRRGSLKQPLSRRCISPINFFLQHLKCAT